MNTITKDEPKRPVNADQCCAGMTMRSGAKEILLEKIERKRREAQELQVLHDALPTVLTPEQDHAIWTMFVHRS